jgi:hypothetical protein
MSEWRAVVGFEGWYEISRDGGVQSVDRTIIRRNRWGGYDPYLLRGQPIIPWIEARTGYPTVGLRRPGSKRTVNVHILVLEAWTGPCPAGMEACHYDDVRTHNSIDNLRWDTRSANTFDSLRNGTRKHGPGGYVAVGPRAAE